MKTILLDATCYNPAAVTGAGRIVYHLVDNLVELDRENRYLIFGFAPQIWPADRLPENFAYRPVKRHPWLGPLAQESARRWFVRNYTTRFRVDLVHFTLEMVPLYDEHTRTLFSLYDLARLSPHFIYTVKQNLRTKIRTRLRYSAAKRADLIHTISDYSARTIHERLRIKRERIRVIPPGFDPSLSPGPPATDVLAKYELADKNYLLFVGEFGRQKNEEGLLKAYYAARADGRIGSHTKLALVGTPDFLQEQTKNLLHNSPYADDVRLLGHIADNDLPHLYRGALALVLPSFYEGFGLPALEAMACGTMPIVTRATSLPEVVDDTGLVVSPGNDAELAGALATAVNDTTQRDRLSARALERAQQFTFRKMTESQLQLYREMTDG